MEAKRNNILHTASKKKLLIVDDDRNLSKLMFKVLEKSFEISVIDNASQAVEECLNFSPDILLLDLNMPNIDGFEVLNILNQHPVLCDLPVVTMTSNKDEDYRKRAHEEGSCGMIYKPFNMGNLARDIEGVFSMTENILLSKNQRVSYSIEFSENRKNKKIIDIITEQNFDQEPLVILSWNRGEDFLEGIEGVDDLIQSGKLVFLEIKPSLISKFPYLQNITPVTLEIKKFLHNSSRKYHLVLEEPRHLLNIHQKERSISQAYNMAQMIHSDFNRITYIDSRPHSEDAIKFLFKIGRILTGVQN
ncbi:MAG: response regulator [Halobacteriovoraceae bacterium]|jgi:CheY-like chemotaxis protein|nr:response regulator [Halobacteriovoraceae bacterium]